MEELLALKGPWGVALLAVYAIAIVILVVQKDWQGLGRGLMRTIVSFVLVLVALGLMAGRAVEGPRVTRPWLGIVFGTAVAGASLGLLFSGVGRFARFKIWEFEVGEAIVGKGLFTIVLPLIFLWLQGQVPMAWGFHLRDWGLNLGLALLLGAIVAIPLSFRLSGKLGGKPLSVSLLAFGIAFAYHLFQTGLPEEFFWRAYLQTHMEALLGSRWGAIILNAWLFGWLHIPFYLLGAQTQYHLGLGGKPLKSAAYATLNEASGGLVYAVVWAQTGSLIPVVFLHALENAFSMAPGVARKLLAVRG